MSVLYCILEMNTNTDQGEGAPEKLAKLKEWGPVVCSIHASILMS
jgi:hypothetical protein